MNAVAASHLLQPGAGAAGCGKAEQQIHVFCLVEGWIKTTEAIQYRPSQHPGTWQYGLVGEGQFMAEPSPL
jgi:hypothetical protein